ncbi:uncharacterized protein LOC133903702 [Phragmites australis]|uniref:uncharacterized protein LOC133903702 n=1 Tax=Phragmites australis TaxID=29695 RepID=UPI002D794435|nr:uncharacterized protein LOC133903702 [Phragmites australis]
MSIRPKPDDTDKHPYILGRGEDELADVEMPGLVEGRAEFGPSKPFAGARIDCKEIPKAHMFKADVPGLKEEEEKVKDGNILQTCGKRNKEQEKTDTGHRVECSSWSPWHENAKTQQIWAPMENGVLTIIRDGLKDASPAPSPFSAAATDFCEPTPTSRSTVCLNDDCPELLVLINSRSASFNPGDSEVTREVPGLADEGCCYLASISHYLSSGLQVHYTDTLLDETKFDSIRDRGTPCHFNLGQGQVLKGWDQGIKNMKREIAIFTIPLELAYDESGSPPTISPNATLQFEVELLSWNSVKDICKYGGIFKKVLKGGEKRESTKDRDEVLVKNEAQLEDGTIVSKLEGVEFIVKDGYFYQALVRAVKTMKKAEKVLLTIQHQYGFGKKGRPAAVHAHASGADNDEQILNAMVQCLIVLVKLQLRMPGPDASTESIGMALKELFVEAGTKNEVVMGLNPWKLLESIHAWNSQYKGYLMHDSYELLYLLRKC